MDKPIETLGELQQLDRVLLYFSEHGIVSNQKDGIDIPTLSAFINQKTNCINELNMQKVISKLLKDEFIENLGNGKYTVTWEGRYFWISSDGYLGKQRQKQKDLTDIQELKLASQLREKQILILTLIMAFGAAVASWYYLTELWKFYNSCCSCHHN